MDNEKARLSSGLFNPHGKLWGRRNGLRLRRDGVIDRFRGRLTGRRSGCADIRLNRSRSLGRSCGGSFRLLGGLIHGLAGRIRDGACRFLRDLHGLGGHFAGGILGSGHRLGGGLGRCANGFLCGLDGRICDFVRRGSRIRGGLLGGIHRRSGLRGHCIRGLLETCSGLIGERVFFFTASRQKDEHGQCDPVCQNPTLHWNLAFLGVPRNEHCVRRDIQILRYN